MMDLNRTREALATALEALGIAAFAYVPEDLNHSPAAIVTNDMQVSWDQSMARGLDKYDMQVLLVVARATEKQGQALIGEFCAGSGPKSLKAALEADRTLGGACSALHVHSFTDFNRLVKFGNAEYLTVTAHITIYG